MPTRFQQRRAKGWSKPPGGRCVSRPSRYGNPFLVPSGELGNPAAHADAVARYRQWITSPAQVKLLDDARRELRGLDLGCYCPLDVPCHADVLLELVNGHRAYTRDDGSMEIVEFDADGREVRRTYSTPPW